MHKVKWTPILAAGLFAMMGMAWAADTGTITVTVSLQSISVSLDTSTWDIGPIALGGSSTLPTVTATNNGNVATDLAIKGADGAGAWAIGTQGADAFEVDVASPVLKLSTTNQTLVSGLAPSGTKAIDLTYKAPTSDTKGPGVAQGFSITITASKTP